MSPLCHRRMVIHGTVMNPNPVIRKRIIISGGGEARQEENNLRISSGLPFNIVYRRVVDNLQSCYER